MDDVVRSAENAILEAHRLGKRFSMDDRILTDVDFQSESFMLYMRKRQLEEAVADLKKAAMAVERQTRWTVARCAHAQRCLI